MPFVDTSFHFDEVPCLTETKSIRQIIIKQSEPSPTPPDPSFDATTNIEPTFDGKWSSDEDNDNNSDASDDEYSTALKKPSRRRKGQSKTSESRKHFWSHKLTSLQGKIGCKYCDTVFRTKIGLSEHICKYLQCDPKNFICRVCHKELSKKTFSNHLHETLDCQFCGKKFVNPRNMKAHLRMQHNFTDKLLPAKREIETDETENIVKEEKIRKPRKKEKLECGKLKSRRRIGEFI